MIAKFTVNKSNAAYPVGAVPKRRCRHGTPKTTNSVTKDSHSKKTRPRLIANNFIRNSISPSIVKDTNISRTTPHVPSTVTLGAVAFRSALTADVCWSCFGIGDRKSSVAIRAMSINTKTP